MIVLLSFILFDMNHTLWQSCPWANLRQINDSTLVGYKLVKGWGPERHVYFAATFSCKLNNFQILQNGKPVIYDTKRFRSHLEAWGEKLMACVRFETQANQEIYVKTAISGVSTEGALRNLQELNGFDFDRTREAADRLWEKELSKFQVKGDLKTKQTFYTSAYHAALHPFIFQDVDGMYRGLDKNIEKAENFTNYTTFSLWDTFRAAHPLYTLIHTHRIPDFVKSMMRQYDYYGYLPVWQLWGQDNYCMIGNHSIPVIVDAVLKGVAGVDEEKAYEAVFNSSIVSHPNSPFEVWEKYGYMPENIQTQSVSITLEQAFDDWCVAQLAKRLGKEKDYNHFMKRSAFYRNLFNSKTGFFQPKNDKGEWIEPFDPYKYGANGGYPFTEGNAWQYFWYVPQNIPDLISLTGGNKAFVAKLDTFFTVSYQSGALNDNASGFVGQYAHGNEPSHHVAYLYACAGEPWKTQKYVAYIMNELYNDSSSGYAGNDDCGEMSAWYVFGALGFYPVNPVSGEYVIGTPMLEEAVIQLPGRKTFTVKAPRKEDNEVYICSMKLNGEKYTKNYITHQDIMKGGILEFVMTASPGK